MDAIERETTDVEAPKIAREVTHLPLARVVPTGMKPLTADDEPIDDIRESIANSGLLHAIVVRPAGGVYEIISGNRRFAAYQHLAAEFPNEKRFKRIPARIADIDDDLVPIVQLADDLDGTARNVLEVCDVIAGAIERGVAHETIMRVLAWKRARLNRHLQIQKAPMWLRGCAITVRVRVRDVDDQLHPMLDPQTGKPAARFVDMAGLPYTQMFELVTLYNVLVREDLLQFEKEEVDRDPPRAIAVVRDLICRTAIEHWSTAQLRAAIAHVKDPSSPPDARVEVKPPFSIRRGKCVIDLDRAASMTHEELVELARGLMGTLRVFAFKDLLITA